MARIAGSPRIRFCRNRRACALPQPSLAGTRRYKPSGSSSSLNPPSRGAPPSAVSRPGGVARHVEDRQVEETDLPRMFREERPRPLRVGLRLSRGAEHHVHVGDDPRAGEVRQDRRGVGDARPLPHPVEQRLRAALQPQLKHRAPRGGQRGGEPRARAAPARSVRTRATKGPAARSPRPPSTGGRRPGSRCPSGETAGRRTGRTTPAAARGTSRGSVARYGWTGATASGQNRHLLQ